MDTFDRVENNNKDSEANAVFCKQSPSPSRSDWIQFNCNRELEERNLVNSWFSATDRKMYRRFASADRLPSTRSEATRSPYAKNYRTNLTHDQRELLSHRQSVSKLPRRELEDRYIALMDEHFVVKKDNALNNEKIKKMATKLLRLSSEGKGRGAPFPLQLSPNEHLEIQIIRLEAYNALLKDRLSIIIRKYSNSIRSTTASISTIRRPASCSNLSLKQKMTLSQDDINLLEIPEPPEVIINKIDNQSNCGGGGSSSYSGIADRRNSPSKSAYKGGHQPSHQPQSYQQSQSSTIFENDNESNVPETILGISAASAEDKSTMNDLKNSIQKLENELAETHSNLDSMKRMNATLETRLTNEMVSKRITENVELIGLRKTMADCETELHELRQQYIALRAKAETELDEEQRKLSELSDIVKREMDKNRILNDELVALKSATNMIQQIQAEVSEQQTENKHLNVKQQQPQRLTTITEELSTNQDNVQKLSSSNEELNQLLAEAKTTIIDLQHDVKAFKEKVETLQQQNDQYARELESNSNDGAKKAATGESAPPVTSIPLEPIVIVDSKTDARRAASAKVRHNRPPSNATAGDDHRSHAETNSSDEDDSSEDVDTYVVKAPASQPQAQRPTIQRSDETASEISSIDSDDNYRTFQKKNKQLKRSLLLHDSNGMPLDFLQRLQLLERAAFYRPLSNVAPEANFVMDNDEQRVYLACNCAGRLNCERQTQTFHEEIRKAVENAKTLLLKEIQRATADTAVNTSAANDLSETQKYSSHDESSECRELLRVQYNLNNLYKQELEFMCKTCTDQTQSLLGEIEALKAKIQSYEDQMRQIEQSADGVLQMNLPRSNQALQINGDQGAFELHVDALKLTKEGRALLSCRHGKLGEIFVSWKFVENELESKTPTRHGPHYTFQSTNIYVVHLSESFLNRLQNEPIEVNVVAALGFDASASAIIGRADINFSEVLMFPQNKIQLTIKVMSSIDGECPNKQRYCTCHGISPKQKHLGNLSIWFRLTCELSALKRFTGRFWSQRSGSDHPAQVHLNESPAAVEVVGDDPDPLIVDTTNCVSLSIDRLKINEATELLQSGTIDQIFIEFSFLGHRSLKTAWRHLSDAHIKFDFRKSFSMDARDGRNRIRLTKLLQDTERSIKFNLVDTAMCKNDETDSSTDSHDIGFGLMHLGKIVRNSVGKGSDDRTTVEIPILSKTPPYQIIGSLQITIDGILEMQRMQRSEH